jgi:hypothetical protein
MISTPASEPFSAMITALKTLSSGSKQNLIIAAAIGLATGALCWIVLNHLQLGAADFSWALRGAKSMLATQNPYDTPWQQYPLTAAVLAIPFLPFSPAIAAALFFGVSSALLAVGMMKSQGYSGLLIFLAYPYWAALLVAQWSPLIAASAFFPFLLPATMAKPQIGCPVFATRATWGGFAACLAVCAVTLAFVPQWPLLWVRQFQHYQHFAPLFVIPGFLLVLALVRYHDRDAILLFLASLVPQRWFFDAFILWLIPKTRKEMVATVGLSWSVGIYRWYHIPHSMNQVGLWCVLGFYLPMLAVVLLRSPRPQSNAELDKTVAISRKP